MAKKKKTLNFLSKLKKGALHKSLGVKKGKKIPVNMLQKMKGDTALMKKRKLFAKNAKKWHHA